MQNGHHCRTQSSSWVFIGWFSLLVLWLILISRWSPLLKPFLNIFSGKIELFEIKLDLDVHGPLQFLWGFFCVIFWNYDHCRKSIYQDPMEKCGNIFYMFVYPIKVFHQNLGQSFLLTKFFDLLNLHQKLCERTLMDFDKVLFE